MCRRGWLSFFLGLQIHTSHITDSRSESILTQSPVFGRQPRSSLVRGTFSVNDKMVPEAIAAAEES